MNSAAGVSSDQLKTAVRQAARWYATLQSPTASDADQRAWREWLQQSPSHRLAWREVEQVQASVAKVPRDIALPTLRGAALSRRELLRNLGMVTVAVPTGLVVWRFTPWFEGRGFEGQAQYSTATGEQQQLTLGDGGTLVLNTATAVDVRYTATTRLVTLHSGEILIQTAPDKHTPSRPFVVETPQGRVQALGTRFTVRLDDNRTTVTVLDKAVRISPASGGESREIGTDQQLSFTARALGPTLNAEPMASSWLQGSLMVVDMPLKTLLAELARYRKGMLSCSDDIADLKISGAFPLADTDRALAAIARAFPLREIRLTRYWVRLAPA